MRLNVLFILVFTLSYLSCYNQVQKTSEYNELSKEYNNLSRDIEELSKQREENLKKQFDQFTQLFESLEIECKELKNLKSYIDLISKKYSQDEITFLSNLNDNQLELYSKFSESIGGNNISKYILDRKKLIKSLNKERLDKFIELNNQLVTISQMNEEYNKRVNDFEEKKKVLIIYTKSIFYDSPDTFEMYKLVIDEKLNY